MPIISAEGSLSSQGYGQFARRSEAVYIEDVFSTWLYTGNGATQTINNGIDLSTKGGMTWFKTRNITFPHLIYDTDRGPNNRLRVDSTDAQVFAPDSLTAFNTNGFSLGSAGFTINTASEPYVAWTFRKQPKFFDIVSYTGNGVSGRAIPHNLASIPGMVIIKRLDTGSTWKTYNYVGGFVLNLNDSTGTPGAAGNGYCGVVGSTTFTVFSSSDTGSITDVNANGGSYVAYLLATDAGGFGLSGAESVISCGFYAGNSNTNGPIINLGWEPQWVMIKNVNNTANWTMFDTMRNLNVATACRVLFPNLNNIENNQGLVIRPFATGFQITSSFALYNESPNNYMYVAIRRGPMRTPTTGTSVFMPTFMSAGTGTVVTTGFPTDMYWSNFWLGDGQNTTVFDRMRGLSSFIGASYATNSRLITASTEPESSATGSVGYASGFWNTGWVQGNYAPGFSTSRYDFRRAPSFFDVVAYRGNGSSQTQSHNLGVVPELMIVKSRSATDNWPVYSATLGPTQRVWINATSPTGAAAQWNNTAPTATQFTVGTDSSVNSNLVDYIAYLFASCPGVSKVGSYTGTGALQTVNCGFTTGARFVMIKRTDAASDWYVYDSAQGISSGNDPFIILNANAGQNTGTNYLDTTGVGFQLTAAGSSDINVNGGSYIFLAIS